MHLIALHICHMLYQQVHAHMHAHSHASYHQYSALHVLIGGACVWSTHQHVDSMCFGPVF